MHKKYENSLLRIILGVQTVVPTFSSDRQIDPNNTSDSNTLTVFLYSGIENLNLDLNETICTGAGTELKLSNVAASLGFGNNSKEHNSRYDTGFIDK